VVGPVCETGDYLALDRTLPEPKARSAGDHDRRRLWRGAGLHLQHPPLVPEVLVKDDQYAVVRRASTSTR